MKPKELNLTFNQFCYKHVDGLYDPNFGYEEQCTGYKLLRKMVEDNITPATKEEYERWETNPSFKEMFSEPELKYLTFIHVKTRPFIREHWNNIKNLKL